MYNCHKNNQNIDEIKYLPHFCNQKNCRLYCCIGYNDQKFRSLACRFNRFQLYIHTWIQNFFSFSFTYYIFIKYEWIYLENYTKTYKIQSDEILLLFLITDETVPFVNIYMSEFYEHCRVTYSYSQCCDLFTLFE